MNKTILLFTIITFCMSSCIKNYLSLEDDHSQSSATDTLSTGNKNTDKSSYTVKFSAKVNTLNATVSSSGATEFDASTSTTTSTALQIDRYVTVYSFLYMGSQVGVNTYYTAEEGVLSNTQNSTLTLPTGSYEFYALSIGNQSEYPPVISNMNTGLSSGALSNGIDYLSCIINKESITQPTTIDLAFNHSASQLKANIVSGATNVTIDSIANATITPPVSTNSFIGLFTGNITYAKSISTTAIDMNVTGTLCHQILLPLKYSGALTMTFDAYLNGNDSPQSYNVSIPLLNGQLAGGTSYLYQVSITENATTIKTASVNSWTEVNESGDPLTPIPN